MFQNALQDSDTLTTPLTVTATLHDLSATMGFETDFERQQSGGDRYKPPDIEGYGYGEGEMRGDSARLPGTGVDHQGTTPAGGTAGGVLGMVGSAGSYVRNSLMALFNNCNINYDLLISKTFYFFFFAAFGSLFPLIAVYFKQLGMNPTQTGVLIGFRPIVEFISGPFWSNIADRWNKWRQILLFSLFCWVAFTLALAFVVPPANSCLIHNGSDVIVVGPWYANHRSKRSTDNLYGAYSTRDVRHALDDWGKMERYAGYGRPMMEDDWGAGNDTDVGTWSDSGYDNTVNKTADSVNKADTANKVGLVVADQKLEKEDTKAEKTAGKTKKATASTGEDTSGQKKGEKKLPSQQEYRESGKEIRFLPHPTIDAYGKSPLPLDHKDIANLDQIDVEGLVSPPYSAVVYRTKDIQATFLILLILMIIGEFVCAPAIELADAATLGYLGDDIESYGKQRLFGSIGWGVAMFFVGIALDYSNIFPNHPCGSEQLVDRNYTVCFAVFAVLMCCAFIAATQFRFKEGMGWNEGIPLSEIKDKVMDKVNEKMGRQKKTDKKPLTEDGGQYGGGYGGGTGSAVPPAGGDAGTGQDKMRISLHDSEPGGGGQADMISDVKSGEDITTRPSPFIPRGRPGQSGRLPQWLTVLRMFGTIKYGSLLFILWFMGFGVGMVFAFLFWHLQDLEGTPTLFGMASVINHISEVAAYIFARKLMGLGTWPRPESVII